MKKLIFLLALLSPHVQAQICEDNSKLGSLSEIADKKCFNDEVSPDDIDLMAGTKSELKTLCKNCQNIPLTKLFENKDAIDDTRPIYGKTVLNEFQKELSFLTIDLMRVRSSFSMNIPTDQVATSCDIKKHLAKPSCLPKEKFKELILPIQNSLATELADLIGANSKPSDGLFIKRTNSCGVEDSDALFAHMRYAETLLTPEFISQLKGLNLKKGKSLKEEIQGKTLPESFSHSLDQLSNHPIFKSLLDDTTSLNNFIKDASAVKASKNIEEDSFKIVDILFQDHGAKAFAKKTSSRCENLFKSTSTALEEIYCGKDSVAADDLVSMQAISGSSFKNMQSKKAENELSIHCAILNSNEDKKFKSFDGFLNSIHNRASSNLIKAPLKEFKEIAYTDMFQNIAENICSAQKSAPPCSSNSKSQQCVLLKFYSDSKTNKNYQDMAKKSDDSINKVLQSLVGDGLPQKDGKVDTVAVALLKDERILPGGSTQPAPKKATASEFHRTVRSSGGGSSIANVTPPTTTQTPQLIPGEKTANSNSGTSTSFSNSEDESSESSSSKSSRKSSGSTPSESKFSALSDKEQQELMDRLKNMKSSSKKGKSKPQESDEEDDGNFIGENNLPSSNGSYSASADGITDIDNTRVVNPKINDARFAGKKAVLDPTKKVSSANAALLDANNNRSPASSSGNLTAPKVEISKPSKDENEIKIQVDEKELSRVNEFKDKLKVLLAAHSQELSVVEVGEKIVVKLNNYEIDVVYNKDKGFYEAVPKNKDVPKDYLNTISYYFNVTLKDGKGKRNVLVDAFKNPKK